MDLQVGDRARPDVAALPPGQPGVRPPGHEPGARSARRPRVVHLALAAVGGLLAVNVADYSGVVGVAAVDDVAWVTLVACALFAVAGFGVVRLLLPDTLRTYELLWVLPAGACALALGLSALGYLRVTLDVSLPIVVVAFAGLDVYAWRRRGLPARPASVAGVAWPLWIAVLVACVALIPTFKSGILTVPGTGSDAHLAAGTARFLQEHHPTEVAVEEPVDRVPLVWRSKPPIYYPLAAVATVSGVETWQAFPVVGALLFAIAALGFYLLARDGLGAGLAGAAVGMAVVGLDRVALQTVTHPYFNQLWGFAVLPFALLLAWKRAWALLAMFLLVGAFAYPLMLPIPLVALAALYWPERRRLRSLWRWWLIPLGLIALVPLQGVVEKITAAVGVVADPTASLRTWGGDLAGFIPEYQFLGMSSWSALVILGPLLLVALVWELRRQPRPLALALGGVLVFGVLAAIWFRPRDFGWYFHFKALAFVGPLALLIATVGVSRLRLRRWLAPAALVVLVMVGVQAARDEMVIVSDQTPRSQTGVQEVDDLLPPGASVRLDVWPGTQLWTAYFLAGQPLCSQKPLLDTSYPHVPVSRKADFILSERADGRPRDATGAVLWQNEHFALHRMGGSVPGPENCSQEMVQTIKEIRVTGRARGG